MKAKNRFLSVVLTLALCMPFSLTARAADDETSIKKLDEVVVTATKTEEKIMDIPVDVQVISSEDIEMSGAADVSEVISKYITGHVHRYDNSSSSVRMRGMESSLYGFDFESRVLILVDGHRLGTSNLAKISLDNVERIEVIKGPASSLYGSAGMGGVINIITKKGGGEFKATLKQELGSFGYQKTSASGSGSLGEKFAYILSGSTNHVDNYKTPDNGEAYNSEVDKTQFSGNLTYFFDENHDVRLGGSHTDFEGEGPDYDEDDETYDQDYNAWGDKDHQYYDLEYNGSFLDNGLHWKALGYYLEDKYQYYKNDHDGDTDDSYTKYLMDTWGTEQQFTIKLIPFNEIALGFVYDNLSRDTWGKDDGADTTPFSPSMSYITTACYLQDSIDLLDNRLNIVVGVRYDQFDVETEESGTNTLEDFEERSETFDHYSPKIGISYKLYKDLVRIRANVGQGFMAPPSSYLVGLWQSDSMMSSSNYLGNPDLDPEVSTSYEGGFDISHDFIDFGLTYFYTDYQDKIAYASDKVTYKGEEWKTWENIGEAVISGFDLNVNWRISRYFDWTPSLSLYSNMTFNTIKEDEENDEELDDISDYEIKSGLQFGYENTRANLSNVWIGPQKDGDDTKDAFAFWDLTFKQGLYDHWELDIAILNLFDQDYSWVEGYPMAERNFRIGLSYTF